jgi:putative membrane protein
MPDFATTDLAFAIGHHLLIFALAAVLAFEIGAIKPGMTGSDARRVGRVDAWYGILAALILIVGFGRINFAAKGWAYYAHNHFFWAKMASFAMVGILSIWPTMAIIRWRRTGATPTDAQVAAVRRFLWAEVFFFALIPVFAAAMARGYGSP